MIIEQCKRSILPPCPIHGTGVVERHLEIAHPPTKKRLATGGYLPMITSFSFTSYVGPGLEVVASRSPACMTWLLCKLFRARNNKLAAAHTLSKVAKILKTIKNSPCCRYYYFRMGRYLWKLNFTKLNVQCMGSNRTFLLWNVKKFILHNDHFQSIHPFLYLFSSYINWDCYTNLIH